MQARATLGLILPLFLVNLPGNLRAHHLRPQRSDGQYLHLCLNGATIVGVYSMRLGAVITRSHDTHFAGLEAFAGNLPVSIFRDDYNSYAN